MIQLLNENLKHKEIKVWLSPKIGMYNSRFYKFNKPPHARLRYKRVKKVVIGVTSHTDEKRIYLHFENLESCVVDMHTALSLIEGEPLKIPAKELLTSY